MAENDTPAEIRTIRLAAVWAGVSVRTIQRWLDRHPDIAEIRDGVFYFSIEKLAALSDAHDLIGRRRNG